MLVVILAGILFNLSHTTVSFVSFCKRHWRKRRYFNRLKQADNQLERKQSAMRMNSSSLVPCKYQSARKETPMILVSIDNEETPHPDVM
jgi:hypothetical protein